MYTKGDMDPKNTYTKYTHLGQITEKLVKLCEKKKEKRFGVACIVIVIPYINIIIKIIKRAKEKMYNPIYTSEKVNQLYLLCVVFVCIAFGIPCLQYVVTQLCGKIKGRRRSS